jgi:PPOX class probable F420-dependent enzyme
VDLGAFPGQGGHAASRSLDRHVLTYPAPTVEPSDASRVRRFVAAARRGTLATLDQGGRPRLVPICFVVDDDGAGGADAVAPLILYSPIDEKPKRTDDPMALARVRDLVDRPAAAVLVDQWSEDWRRLGWVRLACRGEIVPPDAAGAHERAVAALRAKYPQYRAQRLEGRPLIRLTCSVASSWGDIVEES